MRTGHPARRGWCESAHRNYATAMQNKHGPVPASWGFAYVLAWRYCPAPLSLVTVARSRSRSGGTHQSSVGTLRNTPGTLPRDYSRPNRPNLLVCTGAQFYAQTIRSSRRSPPSTAPASVWPRVQLQAGPGEAASAAVPRCGLRCPARGSGLESGKPGSPGSQRPSSLLLALCTPIVPLPSPFLPLLTSTRRSTVPFWYLGQGPKIFWRKSFFFVIQQTTAHRQGARLDGICPWPSISHGWTHGSHTARGHGQRRPTARRRGDPQLPTRPIGQPEPGPRPQHRP